MRIRSVEALALDLRFAIRSMRRRRLWTLGVVLTLSLGMGAAAAVFTVLNALMLHPLFYQGADRVFEVRLRPQNRADPRLVFNPSPRAVGLWQLAAHSVDAIEPIPSSDAIVHFSDQDAMLVQRVAIQPSFLAFAGQRVLLGRNFDERDAVSSAEPRVLLGERLWRNQFGADPRIIGQRFMLDSIPATIIGVAPATLHVPGERPGGVGVWLAYRGTHGVAPIRSLVRLRSGVSVDAARSELDSINRRAGGIGMLRTPMAVVLTPLWDLVPFRSALTLLTVCVALVLLLSCGNVAHMLLARGSARARELAIRAAIGATTTRIWIQLVIESTMLAGVSCVLGLGVAIGVLRLVGLIRPAAAALDAVRLDAFVFGAAAAFACLTGIVFGTLQLPSSRRHGVFRWLARRSIVPHHVRSAGIRTLIFTEAAMAFVILFGASSLLRAVMRLEHTDPGFQTANLYSVRVRPSTGRGQIRADVMDEFARQVRALPGVSRVTFASRLPPNVGPLRVLNDVEIEGRPSLPAGTIPRIGYNVVAPDFFAVAGLRLIEGGTFNDTSETAAQVVLSQATARRLWPGQSPIGQRFRLEPTGAWQVVVGVAADVAAGGLAPESREQAIYLPLTNHAASVLIIRTTGGKDVPAAIRRVAAQVGTGMLPPTIQRVDDALGESIAGPRFAMKLLSIFAQICIVLTALGVYGVLSFAVEQRRKEIGIRLALGGTVASLGRWVLLQALWPALLGVLAGLTTVPWTGSALRATVGSAASIDGTTILIATTAALASLLPAGRAMRTDPALALRLE